MLVLRTDNSDSNGCCRCSLTWLVGHNKSRNSPWPCSTTLEVPGMKGLSASIVFRAAMKHLIFWGLTELLAVHFSCKWTPVWWILSATEVKIHVGICVIISCTLLYSAIQLGVLFDGSCHLDCSLRAYKTLRAFRYVYPLYHSTKAFQISWFYMNSEFCSSEAPPTSARKSLLLAIPDGDWIATSDLSSSCLLGITLYILRR